MKLYLIRHALSKDASLELHQRDDSPIIQKIYEKEKFLNLKPDKVYSSPALRARQTAKKLFEEYEVVDYIYEFRLPKFLYGLPKKEGKIFWDKSWPKVRKNQDWKFGGGESFNEVKKRAGKFLDFLIRSPQERVVVIGHGTFFRHLIGLIKYGDKYTFELFENDIGHIAFKNLEIKRLSILKAIK